MSQALAVIHFQDVQFAYLNSSFALEIDDFALEQGECMALTGASGSGKTTFLHLAAGLIATERGTIVTASTPLETMNGRARSAFRIQHIGLVFQTLELLPHLHALDNLLLPFRLSAHHRLTAATHQEARELARSLGIEHALDRRPDQLSQGEQQRVAIGRALITQPNVILADEPTGNLDAHTKHVVVDLLLDQCAERNMTLLMATHDVDLVKRFDRTQSIHDWAHAPRGGG